MPEKDIDVLFWYEVWKSTGNTGKIGLRLDLCPNYLSFSFLLLVQFPTVCFYFFMWPSFPLFPFHLHCLLKTFNQNLKCTYLNIWTFRDDIDQSAFRGFVSSVLYSYEPSIEFRTSEMAHSFSKMVDQIYWFFFLSFCHFPINVQARSKQTCCRNILPVRWNSLSTVCSLLTQVLPLNSTGHIVLTQ